MRGASEGLPAWISRPIRPHWRWNVTTARTCDAPAGSACRTRGGKTAAKYHTPRFVLAPALREELEIHVPAERLPGRAWTQGPTLAIVPAPRTERPVRIGYARTSTARQELASQLEALRRAQCHKVYKVYKVYKEQISTRVKVRPELEKALALAHQFKGAAPETPIIFTVHELKRLARNAAELMTLSADLQAGGIQLELLTGPLTGIYDPNGMGAMFFAVLAVAGQIERNYIREKTLEGQVIAASKGNHGGRPKVIDDDMLTFALALKDKGVPVPEIAKKLTIKVGKNAGKSPSPASLYRALAEAEVAAADLPLRPKPVRIRRPEDPLTLEETDLRERLQAQPHPNAEIRS
ncbi:recombinase family protein [Streptomyces lasiicapitis]|uniref:recombinase family protein n=1 Tax=Streptomyces lasiicapitis TaxID=1923961 RepID=UPI0036BC4CD1